MEEHIGGLGVWDDCGRRFICNDPKMIQSHLQAWNGFISVIYEHVFKIRNYLIVHDLLQAEGDSSDGVHEFLGVHRFRTAREGGGCGSSVRCGSGKMMQLFRMTFVLVEQFVLFPWGRPRNRKWNTYLSLYC